ncbi:MAG: universal stress protein [Acidobacteriota bacterium]
MISRILLATDFSPSSRRAERTALDLAKAMGASVVVLHAIEPIDPDGDQAPFQGFYASLGRKAEDLMKEITGRFVGAGARCDGRITVARRWRAILDAAEAEGADLIVLGGRQQFGAGHVDMGTTSHKVFLASAVPLLVAREGEELR